MIKGKADSIEKVPFTKKTKSGEEKEKQKGKKGEGRSHVFFPQNLPSLSQKSYLHVVGEGSG